MTKIDKPVNPAFRSFWRGAAPALRQMKAQPPVYFTGTAPLQERAGLSARVDRVEFAPDFDAPPDRPYPFVYAVTVVNDTAQAVTIKARKWVIKEIATGRCHVVEGDGVAGRCPRLLPGQAYHYESYHVVATDSTAEAAFLACDDGGQLALVRLPAFSMHVNH